ncbi:MAG TPA: outer membrane protein assembly factor BamD [Campylobacterales bacterium]|nr:outer membrane protein assembly factor BamD [Campylobacterales bacterium]HHH50808.1 outer membrane protein assembly factor BamD [Campylobacterales bacterium]
MLTNYKKSMLLVVLAVLFIGCSDKDAVKEYDRPALYWYKNIIKNISSSNFDKADNYYISLRSEHTNSPLLPTATLILAQAHIQDQGFLMADYYLDEYLKKYARGEKVELVKFLKIKAAFLGLKDINRDQKLMIDTLKNVDKFTKDYPNSIYKPIVDTLKVRLYMVQYLLNENISRLYNRIGKDKASKIYMEKNKNSMLNSTDIKAPQESFLDKIFN